MTIKYHRTYDSAGDWFAQCEADEANPIAQGRMRLKSRNGAYDYHATGETFFNWSQSNTRKEVLDFARLGWTEGREKIAKAVSNARPLLRAARIKVRSLDVGGAFPFIPAAIAGDPACMFTIGDSERATRPILRLVNEAWGSAGVDAQALTNRGAALLAHIDQLEANDIRVELIHRYSASNCDAFGPHRGKSVNYVVDITAKRADEPMEIDRLAFLLLHPSALRRLYFGSMYTLPAECQNAWVSGYGSPPTQSAREVEHGQILIPSANEWTNDYTSPETSVTRIETFIHDGIKAMGLTGFMQGAGIIIDKEAA